MKTTIKTLCGMLAMLTFTACSSNTDEAINDTPIWHVTLTASMDDEATRALSEGTGNRIIAGFAENDVVVVVDADGNTVGTLKAKTDRASTTIEGTISGVGTSDVLTFRYRSATANYDNQNGTLTGIADNQDYAEGTLTVTATSPDLTLSSNHVTLAAKQSITKFSFTDGTNDVSVKTFGIAAVGLVQSIAADATSTETVGAVTGTLTTAASDVYVALRNNSGAQQTYSFTIMDNDGNWYTGTKKANLANGKNYIATVKLTKLQELTSSSAVGTIGVVGGLPAIAISSNKAVALMNTGALCPEDYGKYYTFVNKASELPTGWRVPTQTELEDLAAITNSWGAPNGVNGRKFTIGDNVLFLPAAGLYDNDPTPATGLSDVSIHGYYWSSTASSDDALALRLNFYEPDNTDSNISVGGDAKVNALTVRPFHDL